MLLNKIGFKDSNYQVMFDVSVNNQTKENDDILNHIIKSNNDKLIEDGLMIKNGFEYRVRDFAFDVDVNVVTIFYTVDIKYYERELM